MNLIWDINNQVAIYLNHFVINNHLQTFIRIFADSPIFFLPIFLIWFWLYYVYKWKVEDKVRLLYVFYAVVIWVVLNTLFKLFIFEHRPEWIIKPILSHVPDNSFPSDHATVSVSFLTALYLFGYKKTFWFFLPFVILMNFARIAGWIHWFFDIIVWMILWILSAFVIYWIKDKDYTQKLNKFLLKIASFIKL